MNESQRITQMKKVKVISSNDQYPNEDDEVNVLAA